MGRPKLTIKAASSDAQAVISCARTQFTAGPVYLPRPPFSVISMSRHHCVGSGWPGLTSAAKCSLTSDEGAFQY